MTKGLKACLTVISTHATVTHPAEGHVAGSNMQNGIVNATASKGKGAKCPGLHALIPGKQIKSQRLFKGNR